jgi:hypothetical protein
MVPYFWMMDSGNSWAVWIGITLLGGCIYSAMAGSQPAFFSELFPANLRYTGVAGAREFGAIAGGRHSSYRGDLERGLCERNSRGAFCDLHVCGDHHCGHARPRNARQSRCDKQLNALKSRRTDAWRMDFLN